MPPKPFTKDQRIAAFWQKVRKTESCWLWTGAVINSGYGFCRVADQTMGLAHRLVYELMVGKIPAGLTIDHLCGNRLCVNPAHLEPVSLRENILRGDSPSARQARQTHCKRGHLLAGDNLVRSSPTRQCRTCWNARARLRRA